MTSIHDSPGVLAQARWTSGLIDDRSPREIMRQALGMAGLFTYYNQAGEWSGQWDDFYQGAPLMRYAQAGSLDLNTQRLRLDAWLWKVGARICLEETDVVAAAWHVIAQMLAYYVEVERLLQALSSVEAERDFLDGLRELVERKLSNDFRAVWDCVNWLSAKGHEAPFELHGWWKRGEHPKPGLLDKSRWPVAAETLRFPLDSSTARAEVARLLSESTWSTFGAMAEVVAQARALRARLPGAEGHHAPLRVVAGVYPAF